MMSGKTKKKMKMEMTGKMADQKPVQFHELYWKQLKFQEAIIKKYQSHLSDGILPVDNPELFQYHMTSMVEELGEVLKADKRWKTHRNDAFDPENKLEEISDVFIIFMNLCIYSGYGSNVVLDRVDKKISENLERMIKNNK